MKYRILLLLIIAGLATISAMKGTNNEDNRLEISVLYERQPGPGSNQYAIWIEDAEGKLVKTLFVTNFTAKGGYIRRPACTPSWIKTANTPEMTETQIDAVSGATPQSGNHIYKWDMTDSDGNKVKPGTYTFIVEANLWNDSMVTYKGTFETGTSDKKIKTTPVFTKPDEEKNKGMISAVTATYFN